MKKLSDRYLSAMRRSLQAKAGSQARLAREIGTQAVARGLDVLDVAKVHERALLAILPADGISAPRRREIIRSAGKFFGHVIVPMERRHLWALETNARLNDHNRRLNRHTGQLTTSNRHLAREIARRKVIEVALKKSKLHFAQLLAQSHQMQERLRQFSRRVLMAQEAERKAISRELHDEIAQTLTGINVHLAALKLEATTNAKGLARKITRTQRIVEKSVDIVHRFARDLRPTVLDDLGLLPALRGHVREFEERTRIRVRMSAAALVEQLTEPKKIVLYRVAQAALSNIQQHASASVVSIRIWAVRLNICMEIHDDGKSFDVERVLLAKRHKRLGVLGMRERVELVGGSFVIRSERGKGTSIKVSLPSHRLSRR